MKKHRLIHVALSLLACSTLIFAQGATPVRVMSPNGGETWQVGSTQVIQWQYNGTEKPRAFSILLSTDGGKSFGVSVIGQLPPDAREYKWTVKAAETRMAIIQVNAQLSLGNPMLPGFRNESDVSDARFSIVSTLPPPIIAPKPTVTVVSPNGGEVWVNGTSQLITWKFSGTPLPASFSVMLSMDAGKTYQPIAANLSGKESSYKWTVKGMDSKTNLIKVTAQMSDVSQGQLEDVSDGQFAIMTKTENPAQPVTPPIIQKIVFAAPKAGEVVADKSAMMIQWKRLEGTPAPEFYAINLSSDAAKGFPISVAKQIPGTSDSYKWLVQVTAPMPKAQLQIIAYYRDHSVEAVSDAFSIK